MRHLVAFDCIVGLLPWVSLKDFPGPRGNCNNVDQITINLTTFQITGGVNNIYRHFRSKSQHVAAIMVRHSVVFDCLVGVLPVVNMLINIVCKKKIQSDPKKLFTRFKINISLEIER